MAPLLFGNISSSSSDRKDKRGSRELRLKMQLLTNYFATISDVQKRMAAKNKEIKRLKRLLPLLTSLLAVINWSQGALLSDLDSTRAALRRRKGIIFDFSERVCVWRT